MIKNIDDFVSHVNKTVSYCSLSDNPNLIELQYLLFEATCFSDFDIIKMLLTSSYIKTKPHLQFWDSGSNPFLNSCFNNDIEIVRFFLESPLITLHADINQCDEIDDYNEAINVACRNGHVELFDFLLHHPTLVLQLPLEKEYQQLLFVAVERNQASIVDYLLTSSSLIHHPDIAFNHHQLIINACEYGSLEVIQYLLTSSKLKNHSDISTDEYKGFKLALFKGHDDIIDYLIFEYNIEYLGENFPYLKDFPLVQALFEKRELNKKLNLHLPHSDIEYKKTKV